MDNSSVLPGRFPKADLDQLRQVLHETAAAAPPRFMIAFGESCFPVSFCDAEEADLAFKAGSMLEMVNAIAAAGGALAKHGDPEDPLYPAKLSSLFSAGELISSMALAMRGQLVELP